MTSRVTPGLDRPRCAVADAMVDAQKGTCDTTPYALSPVVHSMCTPWKLASQEQTPLYLRQAGHHLPHNRKFSFENSSFGLLRCMV